MKKKTLCLASLSTFLCLGMAYISNNNAPIHTHAEGEKETVYFNVTTEKGLNENIVILSTDTTIPTNAQYQNFNWTVNNEVKQTYSLKSTEYANSFMVAWSESTPSAQKNDDNNYYTHYKIKAGTIIFSDDTTNYVLQNDYNFWSTRGDSLGYSYIFQHGGHDDYRGTSAGDINILRFTKLDGGNQPDQHRFLLQPSYEETSTAWTANGIETARCPIYINKGNGYVLSASTSVTPMIWADGQIKNEGEQLLFLMQYQHLFDSATDKTSFEDLKFESDYYSFYIPSNTLWGGIQNPFMIKGDYYFEIYKDGGLHGFYTDIHDYVKHEAKAATCSEEGNNEYYTCDRSTHGGTEYFIKNSDGTYVATTKEKVTISATGKHTYEVHQTEVGDITVKYYICGTCGKYFTSKDGETYTEITLTQLNALIANAWGKYFLETTAEPCKAGDGDNLTALETVWDSKLKVQYEKLENDVKAVIKAANADANGTDLENANARYDHIINKYTSLNDFIGRVTTSGSKNQMRLNSNDTLIIVLVSTLSCLTLLSLVLIASKKKLAK